MTGRTHAVVGANTLWLLMFTDLMFNPWLVLVAAFSALLPDLDASESLVKNFTVSFGAGRSRVAFKPFAPIAVVMSSLFRHRGWLHSWVAVVVVAGVSIMFFGRYGAEYPFVITIGYISHLFVDALTKSGIEFLLPFKQTITLLPRTLRVRTGGMVDTSLFVIGALTLAMYVVMMMQSGVTLS